MKNKTTTKKTKLLTIFRVGNDERPAGPQDVIDFKQQLKNAIDNNEPLITHYAVDFFNIEIF